MDENPFTKIISVSNKMAEEYDAIVLVRKVGFGKRHLNWNSAKVYLPDQQPISVPLSDWIFERVAAFKVDMRQHQRQLHLDNIRPTAQAHTHWTCELALRFMVNQRPEDVLTIARSRGNPIEIVISRLSAAIGGALQLHDEDPRVAIRRSLANLPVVAGLKIIDFDIVDVRPDEELAEASRTRDKARILEVPTFLGRKPEDFVTLLVSGEGTRLDLAKTILREVGDSPAAIEKIIHMFDHELDTYRKGLITQGRGAVSEQAIDQVQKLLVERLLSQTRGTEINATDTVASLSNDQLDLHFRDIRLRRLASEVASLRAQFGALDWDDIAGDWVAVARLPLPPSFPTRTTAVLVEIPPRYPTDPPTAIFVKRGLLPVRPVSQSVTHGRIGWDPLPFPTVPWDAELDSITKIIALVPDALEATRSASSL